MSIPKRVHQGGGVVLLFAEFIWSKEVQFPKKSYLTKARATKKRACHGPFVWAGPGWADLTIATSPTGPGLDFGNVMGGAGPGLDV